MFNAVSNLGDLSGLTSIIYRKTAGIAALMICLLSELTLACPINIFASELMPLPRVARKDLKLFIFSKTAQSQVGSWKEAPLQIDPIDEDGHLEFYDDEAFRKDWLRNHDMITLTEDSLGEAFSSKDLSSLPCKTRLRYRIKAGEKFGVIVSCGAGISGKPERDVRNSFVYKQDEHYLASPTYKYIFNPDNYMQFLDIAFHNGKVYQTVARNSSLFIRADAKNFFNLTFDSSDIESEMEKYRIGELGHLAKLSFYLKVLFFRIKMSLSTDVIFYEDSAHIPMMVNLPVDATKYLNHGSGILYSWELAEWSALSKPTLHMPSLDVEASLKGPAELAKLAERYCKNDWCSFKFELAVSHKKLAMLLRLPRVYVNRGFFPQFVDSASRHAKKMGWEINPDAQERMGLYFEVSGLEAGTYPWDFWMQLGNSGQSARTCPSPAIVSGLL